MHKKRALAVARRLTLATVWPGFDPREIEDDYAALSEAGWKFENTGRGMCTIADSDGDGWVIKAPKKGHRKTVAYTIPDYALFEAAGSLISRVGEAKTRREVDSLAADFAAVCSEISAASLVSELEEGMAHAVSEADSQMPGFDAVRFAEEHGLEYRHTGLNEWVSGDTRPHREALKAEGFKWAAKKRQWYRKAA